MRTIICGGRDYMVTLLDEQWLDEQRKLLPITLVIEGGCRRKDYRGDDLPTADLGAYQWAMKRAIPVATMDANWSYFGKSAGPKRNSVMAELGEICIAFPGGRGTQDMMDKAEQNNLRVIKSPGRGWDF